MIISAQSSGSQSTNNSAWTAIPGLWAEYFGATGDTVLSIYARPTLTPPATICPAISVSRSTAPQLATATFTYNEQNPPSTGRIPTTLCVPFLVK